jgi:hypothetical protein
MRRGEAPVRVALREPAERFVQAEPPERGSIAIAA